MDFRDSKIESLGGDTSAVVVENGPVQYIENLKEGETHYMFYGKYLFYGKFEGERQYMLYDKFERERQYMFYCDFKMPKESFMEMMEYYLYKLMI